jgi:hypothetical protein
MKEQQKQREFLGVMLRKLNKGEKNINAGESSSSFQTSFKKCEHCMEPAHNIDDFNAAVTRKTVYSFYRVEKFVPPLLGL